MQITRAHDHTMPHAKQYLCCQKQPSVFDCFPSCVRFHMIKREHFDPVFVSALLCVKGTEPPSLWENFMQRYNILNNCCCVFHLPPLFNWDLSLQSYFSPISKNAKSFCFTELLERGFCYFTFYHFKMSA